MEKCISTKLKSNFYDINPNEYWDEIIQLTFIKNDFEYISITRIPYEDEIYIEHNDQINFLTCHYTDFNYILNGNILDIKIKKVCESSNVFPNISILLNFDTDSLEYILSNIVKETID